MLRTYWFSLTFQTKTPKLPPNRKSKNFILIMILSPTNSFVKTRCSIIWCNLPKIDVTSWHFSILQTIKWDNGIRNSNDYCCRQQNTFQTRWSTRRSTYHLLFCDLSAGEKLSCRLETHIDMNYNNITLTLRRCSLSKDRLKQLSVKVCMKWLTVGLSKCVFRMKSFYTENEINSNIIHIKKNIPPEDNNKDRRTQKNTSSKFPIEIVF